VHDPIPRASEVLVFLCVHIGMKVSRACTQIYWTFRSCNLMGDDAHREKAKTNVWREFARELESDKNELLEVVERLRISIELLVTTAHLHLCTHVCVVYMHQDDAFLLNNVSLQTAVGLKHVHLRVLRTGLKSVFLGWKDVCQKGVLDRLMGAYKYWRGDRCVLSTWMSDPSR